MSENRRLPSWAVDLVLALVVLALGLSSLVEINATGASPVYTREPDVWSSLLTGLMSLPLAFRRRFPVSVFLVVLGAWMTDRILDYPGTLSQIGVLLAFHSLGSELEPRRSLRIGIPAVVLLTTFTIIGALTLDSVPGTAPVATAISLSIPLWLGREIHSRRRRMTELEERAERAEREREEQARRAVAEERARIARELHDVVAHQMTVMTLQAEGASRIAGDVDPRVREALATIRDAGKASLAEMRRMVGLLRSDDDSDETAAIEPLPGLSDVQALVDSVREAGLQVELTIDGETRDLPEGTELSAYRIVQESLTNTVRHGGPNVAATVTLAYRPDELDITVVDDGRGAAANGDGTGHGLVGMRERVAVLGGDFSAGPRPGGGFKVSARIPVDV